MPLYEYECRVCGKRFEKVVPLSERERVRHCGKRAKLLVPSRFAAHVWKPTWFEHLDTKPILIESKRQLKEECEKRGLIARCLM